MSKLMPSDIREEVNDVLEEMHGNLGENSCSFLTAYQILERLSSTIRDRLILETGFRGNKGNSR